MDWLERQGIRVIDRSLARSENGAVAAAARLGFPVAAKVVSRQVLHKTDVGGVALDLRSETAVRAAFARLSQVGGDAFEGVLISRMIERPVEALVGLSRDPQFGPVVAVGLGGIYTETLADVALRIAPIDAEEAEMMIAELRGAPILRGDRQRRPRTLAPLAELIARVSEIGARTPNLAELDLNPVFLLDNGTVVADARLVVTSQASERSLDR